MKDIAPIVILLVVFLGLFFVSHRYRLLEKKLATCEATTVENHGHHLYGMDYPLEDHHKQVYFIATSPYEAIEAARGEGFEITSVREIDIPILMVK